MTDIDFIKWMVGYAEGFEIEPFRNTWEVSFNDCYGTTYDDTSKFSLYPLLLQRAIEGINREIKYSIKVIRLAEDEIGVRNNEGEWKYFYYTKDIDQAKEQALKYIYEQEQK